MTITLALYLSAIALLLAVYLANNLLDIPVGLLTRDPAQIHDFAPWSGVISNIGAFLWCASMTLCFAAAAAISQEPSRKYFRGFLLASGFLSAFLLLDDFFVLHETVGDSSPFREKVISALYVLVIVSYLAKYVRQILKTDYVFLVLAFTFLGASFVLDIVPIQIFAGFQYSTFYMVEDGLKLVGIISWFGYFAVLFSSLVKPHTHESTA